MKTCPLQHACNDYNSGDNKPPNNDIRDKHPCIHFISMECSALLEILPKVGVEIACDVEEVREKKVNLRRK